MKVNYKYVTTADEISRLGSAITIEGLTRGPDGTEAFAGWCHEHAVFKDSVPTCYVIKGKTMNSVYHLTGSNAYPSDCNIVSFPLDAFANDDVLIKARFEVGARWLDDIVANNIRREGVR